MFRNNSLVATYANHKLAENTVKKLHQAGFDMSKLYILTKDRHGRVGELEGATVADGLSALDAAQHACLPRERLPDYEAELKNDMLLLVAHGSPDEIMHAQDVIATTHPDSWDGSVSCNIYYGCQD